MKRKIDLKSILGIFSKNRRKNRKKGRKIFYNDVRYNLKRTSMHDKLIAFLKLGLLFIISIIIPILLVTVNKDLLGQLNSTEDLMMILDARKGFAFLILIGLQILQIVICMLPGQPIQFASSYLYGFWQGYLISIIGAIVGTIITYNIAKFLGKDALHIMFGEKRVSDYMKKLNSGKSYIIILLIYLIPGIPKDLMCYVAGLSEIKIRPFLIISTVGRTPGIMGSLIMGTMLESQNYIGLVIMGLIAVMVAYIFYKNRNRVINYIDKLENKDS
ncbi:MAG TPA: VTT domain-containing protein [Anaerovoracaceae bacterium]|nr:VTT domain-containing protein [Anaerovoracaceae bacterium]